MQVCVCWCVCLCSLQSLRTRVCVCLLAHVVNALDLRLTANQSDGWRGPHERGGIRQISGEIKQPFARPGAGGWTEEAEGEEGGGGLRK